MNTIDSFSGKDHEILKNLLEKWKKERDNISQISDDHEGPLFLLTLKKFKEDTLKSTNDCIIKAKQIIPNIFTKSMDELNESLHKALSYVEK